MRCLVAATILVLAGCHTCPKIPPPMCDIGVSGKRPQDMTDRILPDVRFPDWLKLNYAEWIRYAYDSEGSSTR